MAYEAKPLLCIDRTDEGYMSAIRTIYTNGRIIRSNRGVRLHWIKGFDRGLNFLFRNWGVYHQGSIADELISARVLEYTERYYDSHLTNCSAFAHYISTGTFVECEHEQNLAVVGHGMRPFSMASRVGVGDVVFIAYAKERMFRSRRTSEEHRQNFLRAQKEYHARGLFSAVVDTVPKSVEPSVILSLCKNSCLGGYHFMVCVGHQHGEPLWLFQNGYHYPGENHHSFGMTVGLANPYPQQPLFAYIKKRRG
ncbi:hypothetical protein K2X96_01315 [Patescibacteria group bacterium]|nr:hypothetical protein [Patescibacteria group bacterium]